MHLQWWPNNIMKSSQSLWSLQDVQKEYRERLQAVLSMRGQKRVKTLFLEGLVRELRELERLNKNNETTKRSNYQVLSTSISECQSISYQLQKDVDELEENIIRMRMVKFQNNEDIETIEQELYQIEKIVKARSEYNQFMKKKIDIKMESIQNSSANKGEKEKEKSVLNKSLDTVAGILKFKWWG